jgi:hypothetical protein
MDFFLFSLKVDFLFWLFIVIGFIDFLYVHLKANSKFLILGVSLIFPLIFLKVYRNSFPYFYLFIFSPPIIFSGFFWTFFKNKFLTNKFYVVSSSLILIFIIAINVLRINISVINNNNFQKILIENVHRIYPEPVNYIDSCSMISSFNKVGFFASSLGIENYLSKNKPVFRDILLSYEVKLLVANSEIFDLSKDWKDAVSLKGYRLLEDDWNLLKNNFLQHWGLLYLPGKKLFFSKNSLDLLFEILIPGTYTLECDHPVTINEIVIYPGQTIDLTRGQHKLFAQTSTELFLKFGANLFKPYDHPFTIDYIYSKFF